MSKIRIDTKRALFWAKELRNYAVRSRWDPTDFFTACLINAAIPVKPGYERQVVRAFEALIREVRKDMKIADRWEVEDEAFGREYG